MNMGMCRIRSAGRTSGSIEATLPPALQPFTGLGCRVVVRDGLQPEIVLLPDLESVHSLLRTLWQKLSLALGASETLDDFNPGAFTLTLLPSQHWQRGLPLAYADALSLMRRGEERTADDLDSLARILSVLVAAIGRGRGLDHSLALGFGDAVAYAVTQTSAGFGTDFERSMAAGVSGQTRLDRSSPVFPLDDEFWLEWEPALRRIYQQFRVWQNNPGQHEAARQQWYRAHQCESLPSRAERRVGTHVS
jgi:hypothetical protein